MIQMKQKRNEKGQFAKGFTPWNKGRKGLNLGGEKGWFQKGQKPKTTRIIGSERIDKRDGTIQVKVSDRKWVSKQRCLWEEKNGKIPKGHVVIFANGDKRDFSEENLICVSRQQLMVLNKQKLITGDAGLTKSGVLVADLLLGIRDKEKGDEHE